MNQTGSVHDAQVRKFAPEERQGILERLVKELEADPTIAAVAYAGSTSQGFKDEYSDIDIIVISRPEDYDDVVGRWVAKVESMFPVIARFRASEHERKVIYCFLLEGFLELDVLFESITTLSPRRRWKVAFDRTGTVAEVLASKPKEPEPLPLAAYYKVCVESIWYHVTQIVAALYRRYFWKALYELDQVRFRTLGLYGLMANLNTEEYTEVDLLPPAILKDLEKTLVPHADRSAVYEALEAALDLFFAAARKAATETGMEPPDKMESLLRSYLEANRTAALE